MYSLFLMNRSYSNNGSKVTLNRFYLLALVKQELTMSNLFLKAFINLLMLEIELFIVYVSSHYMN